MVTWTFVELDDVGSTQAVARGLAAMGAPEGTTVAAKSQSSGEGRLGRTWVSPAGGLYMSFILRPQHLTRPELVSLVTALAVVQGVRQATGLSTKIRWPNDVMASRKKLAGVIAEAQTSKQEVTQFLVGVGLNCNAPLGNINAGGQKATSLIEELGRPSEISEVKHSILDSFSALYFRWKAGEDMVPLWVGSVGTIGKSVTVKLKTEGPAFSSKASGVDTEGRLLLEKDGTDVALRPEEMEWLREEL